MTEQPGWSAPAAPLSPPPASPPPPMPAPAYALRPPAPAGASTPQPWLGATPVPPPNPLGTYTPVPPVDRPIGYTMSPPMRVSRRARFGGAAGAVAALGFLVVKVLLISHVASSVAGGSSGSPSSQLVELRNAASLLSAELGTAPTPEAKAAELRVFDNALRNIPLSGQADVDRTSALSADAAFEAALTDGGDVPSAQRAHLAAVNQLAHDLSGGDVLTLTSST